MQGSDNKEKNRFWTDGIVGFIKLFLFTILYLGGLAGGMILSDYLFRSLDYAGYFVWVYLAFSIVGYIYYKHKNFFTLQNLRRSIEYAKSLIKNLFKYSGYALLIILGIIIIGAIGGWIASLSVTTIIIILLVLILLK